MHRNTARAPAALMSALLLTVTGCSDSESQSVPELPERICWGVFTADDVAPLMPTGKKAKMSSDPFLLNEEMDYATCHLDIDGRSGLSVSADLLDFEDHVDWSSWDVAEPQPINVGEKGIIWSSGAGTHVACEPSKSPSEPGKYVQMHISTDRSPDKEKLRAALPGLLQQMVAFTKRELHCP